jgi:hypothetical protein
MLFFLINSLYYLKFIVSLQKIYKYMDKYVIGDVVECNLTNKRLIIIDIDTTKNGNNIYLTSNNLWYDHNSLTQIDYHRPTEGTPQRYFNDDELEISVTEYMKTDNYKTEIMDWLNEENRKYDKENKPTFKNFFNILKLFKKEKGKHDGMFF